MYYFIIFLHLLDVDLFVRTNLHLLDVKTLFTSP